MPAKKRMPIIKSKSNLYPEEICTLAHVDEVFRAATTFFSNKSLAHEASLKNPIREIKWFPGGFSSHYESIQPNPTLHRTVDQPSLTHARTVCRSWDKCRHAVFLI
jgi:hypothetical protein